MTSARLNRMAFKFTQESEDMTIAAYREGATMTALSRDLGCSLEAVRKMLKRRKVQTRPMGNFKDFSLDQLAEINTRWQAGESQWSIANSLGVSQTAICHALQRAGYSKETRVAKRTGHGRWRGGRIRTSTGYIGLRVDPSDPLAFGMIGGRGYVMEHRYVMAQQLGRPLTADETVHHINGDRQDNRPENLQLRQGRHGTGKVMKCRACGSHDLVEVPLAEIEAD